MTKGSFKLRIVLTSSKIFALILLGVSLYASIKSKDWNIFKENALLATALYATKTGLEGVKQIRQVGQSEDTDK